MEYGPLYLYCMKVRFTTVDQPQLRQDVDVMVTVLGSCIYGTAEDTDRLKPEQPNGRFLKGKEWSKVAEALCKTVDTLAS